MGGRVYDSGVTTRRQRATRWMPATPAGRAASLAAVAAIGAGGLVALLRWRLWSSGVPDAGTPPLRDFFDPAELTRNRDYRRGIWTMAVVGVPLASAAAVTVALTGGRWRPALVRAARGRPWGAGLAFGVGLSLVTFAVSVPLAAARYAWGRHYGIVTQSVPGWAIDTAKGLAIQLVIAAAIGAGAAALIARAPRFWWAGFAAAIAFFIALMSLLSPILIEPLFQKTAPLNDPQLSAQVLELADRLGVKADDVKVNDASVRTTTANAYVSGLGDSRHIVLYDTLLRDFPDDEVRVVVAHELTHVARRHILKGSIWGAALAIPGCLLIFSVVGWRTGFGAAGKGREGCDLVLRRLAVAAAAATIVSTASTPLSNWVSRSFETEADWGALTTTRDPQADIGLQQGLTKRSLGVPDPPALIQWWFGTHPTSLQRIGLALRYRSP